MQNVFQPVEVTAIGKQSLERNINTISSNVPIIEDHSWRCSMETSNAIESAAIISSICSHERPLSYSRHEPALNRAQGTWDFSNTEEMDKSYAETHATQLQPLPIAPENNLVAMSNFNIDFPRTGVVDLSSEHLSRPNKEEDIVFPSDILREWL